MLFRSKAREASFLPQRLHAISAAGEQLVRVALMADVPDELIVRCVEDMMQRDGQLDDAEPCADVTPGARARIDELLADLRGERTKLVARERFQVGG